MDNLGEISAALLRTNFTSLPLDIIYLILNKLPDRRSLFSVVRSSKSWLETFNSHKDTLVHNILLKEIRPYWKDAVAVAMGLRTLMSGLKPGEEEMQPKVVMKFVREYNHWYGTGEVPPWAMDIDRALEDEMIEHYRAIQVVVRWFCAFEMGRRKSMKDEHELDALDLGNERTDEDTPPTITEIERITTACYRDWLFHIFFRDHSTEENNDWQHTERWSYNGQPLDADMQVLFVTFPFWEFEAMYAVKRIIFIGLDSMIDKGILIRWTSEGYYDFELNQDFFAHFIMAVLGYTGLAHIIRLIHASSPHDRISAKPRKPKNYNYQTKVARMEELEPSTHNYPTGLHLTSSVVEYVRSSAQDSAYRTWTADALYQIYEWYPRFNRNRREPATDHKNRFDTTMVVPYDAYVNPLSRVADPLRIVKPHATKKWLESSKWSSRQRYRDTERVLYWELDWSARGEGGSWEDFRWPENRSIDRGACVWDDWRLEEWGYLMPLEEEEEAPCNYAEDDSDVDEEEDEDEPIPLL